jgi:hypothetical protein
VEDATMPVRAVVLDFGRIGSKALKMWRHFFPLERQSPSKTSTSYSRIAAVT